jgi:hypothetical protein
MLKLSEKQNSFMNVRNSGKVLNAGLIIHILLFEMVPRSLLTHLGPK